MRPEFGDVIDLAADSGPPLRYLVVSSAILNASGLGALGCEVVDLPQISPESTEVKEPIPGAGVALLNRIEWLPPLTLGYPAEKIAALDPARYDSVAARIRNMIGP